MSRFAPLARPVAQHLLKPANVNFLPTAGRFVQRSTFSSLAMPSYPLNMPAQSISAFLPQAVIVGANPFPGNFGARIVSTGTKPTTKAAISWYDISIAMWEWTKSTYNNVAKSMSGENNLESVAIQANAVKEGKPVVRIHYPMPEADLEARGHFATTTLGQIAQYISDNEPGVKKVFGGCNTFDDLCRGYLEGQALENGVMGMIIGVPERSIAAHDIAGDIIEAKSEIGMHNLGDNLVKEREVFFETMALSQMSFYITDLKDFAEGKDVPNLFATEDNGLPKTINREQASDENYIRGVTEKYAEYCAGQQVEIQADTSSTTNAFKAQLAEIKGPEEEEKSTLRL